MARQYVRYMLSFYEEKEIRKEDRNRIRDVCGIDELPDHEFLHNYKFSRDMISYLCEELYDDLVPRNSTGLPVITKVLASIKILLDGHYQRGVGNDSNISISQTTVSKYLDQFVTAVNRKLKPKWIVFPGTDVARANVAANYEEKCGLPSILGSIDCTHIKIFPPPSVQKTQFLNRYCDTSINVQLVADADARILNVNANYPGRVHDQFIFNYSKVKAEMRRLHENRMGCYYLLGDSGYALEPWILTPIRDALPATPEDRYSKWHCRTRNVVERTNGYLKGTFRSLGIDRCLHYSPEKASKLIYTCCTLYNIMKHYRVPMELGESEPNENWTNDTTTEGTNSNLRRGEQRRREIISTYFSH